jgi:hypothetical protein
MKISINLLLLIFIHCFSYGLMNRAIFVIDISVIIDIWLNVDFHIYQDSKICKNFGRNNEFLKLLIKKNHEIGYFLFLQWSDLSEFFLYWGSYIVRYDQELNP